MSNIKTSDSNMNLKPVELTPSELNSVAGGGSFLEYLMIINEVGQISSANVLTQRR
jgi:hypothetical protein